MKDLEAFSITNPSRKSYKFLFRIPMDDETLLIGEQFCKRWVEERGFTIKRQKIVNMLLHGMFQINIWLN
jgi:hypothetical protein